MTSQTTWIPVLLTFLLLLQFWRAKVYASGNSEEIDFTYLIIGVTLGAFLAIAFIAVIICMIKKQMLDHVFRESEGKMDRRRTFPQDSYPYWHLFFVGLNKWWSNMGSSQNRDDTNTPEQQCSNKQ